MDTKPIVVERTYNASAESIWQALTDQKKMKQWYFDIAEFKPEVGFEFEFLAGSDEKKYLHQCKVTEVIIGKKLAYTWRYADFEGNSALSFELFEEGNKTRLVLTHSGLESFPKNNPDFAKESFAEGWNYFVNTGLPKFLEEEEVVK